LFLIEYNQWIAKTNIKSKAQNKANQNKASVVIVLAGLSKKLSISLISLAKKNVKNTITKSRGSLTADKNISCFFIIKNWLEKLFL
jgi:hypothetical protein